MPSGFRRNTPMRLNWNATLPVVARLPPCLVERVSHRGDGAGRVVGGAFDQYRDAVRAHSLRTSLPRSSAASRPEARLIAASTLSFGMFTARAFWMTRRSVGLESRVGSALLDRDRDVLADPAELLRHPVPAREHRVLSDFENTSHGCSIDCWFGRVRPGRAPSAGMDPDGRAASATRNGAHCKDLGRKRPESRLIRLLILPKETKKARVPRAERQ